MNTPASTQGNIVRYIIYILGYLMTFGAMKLALLGKKFNLWGAILFGIVALMILIFYIQRFNRENRYFEKNNFKYPWLNNYGYIILMTLLFVLIRILISYFQAFGRLPQLEFSTTVSNSNIFWFTLIAQGIILSTLQQFLVNGFLFNYYFRSSSQFVGLLGMITSGVFFAILNYSSHTGLLIIYVIIGMLISWSYLYTQTIMMPIYLAVLNGVLTVILL